MADASGRILFACEPWEIRLIKRLRQLRHAGMDRIVLSLAPPQIVEKVVSTPERLDYTPDHAPAPLDSTPLTALE